MATYATLDWHDDQPYSQEFGDVYFSRDAGLAESRHVFLDRNQIPGRFAAMPAGHEFTIAEAGFGTGLNFFSAWQSFLQYAPTSASLHFISFECAPLRPDDLQRALALWPELQNQVGEFLAQYTLPASGWQRYRLAQGRVQLTLLIGDIRTTLPGCDFLADAWFLDGFAPAKNQAMWAPPILQAIAQHTRAGATLATFTSAGWVRRGLVEAGFTLRKVAGYGRKRDMLCGYFGNPGASLGQCVDRHTVLVIGGGLAGCAAAYALALRGHRVDLVERAANLAQGASGNPVGVLYARLGLQNAAFNPLAQMILSSLEYTTRHMRSWLSDWMPCGVLQLAFDEKEMRRAQALAAFGLPENVVRWVSADEASHLAGIKIDYAGLFFSQAGCVSPAKLCAAWVRHPNIEVHTLHPATALQLEQDSNTWCVRSSERKYFSDHVVLACAHEANQLLRGTGLPDLPLWPLRGQILQLQASTESVALRTVLCGKGYCAPAENGQHVCGATFDKGVKHLQVLPAGHAENLAQLGELAQALSALASQARNAPETLQGRASFRCTGPDFTPIIGPLAPGLWTTLAHGARGLLSAPFAAEHLAYQISGLSNVLPQSILSAINPQRFYLEPKDQIAS